jgi:AbrB family looped-hinge helix DNA binding protein
MFIYVKYDKYNLYEIMGEISMGSYKDNHFFGKVKVGERGQIVIPKEARDKFDIKPGDNLIVFGQDRNEKLIILKEDVMRNYALKILEDLDNPD